MLDPFNPTEDEEADYKAYVDGVIRGDWLASYRRAFRILEGSDKISNEDTRYLQRRYFLCIYNCPAPDVDLPTFQALNRAALNAVSVGRLWANNRDVQHLRRLMRTGRLVVSDDSPNGWELVPQAPHGDALPSGRPASARSG